MEVSPSDASVVPAPQGSSPADPDFEAARAGDRAAFARVWRRLAPAVHGVLLSRVRPAEVDDLMQDVFVSALEKVSTLREGAALGAWVCTIARNRAIDVQRSRRKLVEIPEDLGAPDAERAEAERVLRAIQALPEAYRETLTLRLVEGMSGPEIAEQVGLTPESVRVNLHRGMKMLREKLGLGGADE